jgi:hypothetical protein
MDSDSCVSLESCMDRELGFIQPVGLYKKMLYIDVFLGANLAFREHIFREQKYNQIVGFSLEVGTKYFFLFIYTQLFMCPGRVHDPTSQFSS